jgi:hypothetical protein
MLVYACFSKSYACIGLSIYRRATAVILPRRDKNKRKKSCLLMWMVELAASITKHTSLGQEEFLTTWILRPGAHAVRMDAWLKSNVHVCM